MNKFKILLLFLGISLVGYSQTPITVKQGDSFTALLVFDNAYDVNRLQDISVSINRQEVAKKSTGGIVATNNIRAFRVPLSSATMRRYQGSNTLEIAVDDSILGVRRISPLTLIVSASQNGFNNGSVNTGVDATINMTISATSITTNTVLATVMKGDKGDPGDGSGGGTSIDTTLYVRKVSGWALSQNSYTTAEKSKLSGIASGATANSTDAQLRDRSTHTGTQAQSTVTNLVSDLAAKLNIADTTALLRKTTAAGLYQTKGNYLTSINSSQVTTALGYTPYNATNPSGYITASEIAGKQDVITNGSVNLDKLNQSGATINQVPKWNGTTWIPSNDLVGSGGSGTAIDTTLFLQKTTAAGLYQPKGSYLTSINLGQVTTALGFTPYNSTNPNGYITSSALSPYLTSATAASTYQPIGSYLVSADLAAYLPKSDTTLYVRKVSGWALSQNNFTAAEKSKLAGIASGATANDTDANLKARGNHTGVQAQSTITNLVSDLAAKVDTSSISSNVNNTKITITGWGDSMTIGAESETPYLNYIRDISNYNIDNQGVGGETSTQIKNRMLAATAKYSNPVIIWAGRNNYSSPSTVLSDIAAMVAALGHSRYLVVSVCNGAGEAPGNSVYNNIATINTGLASAYGSRYVDLRSYLVAQYNPSIPQDVTDNLQDIIPSSLRVDGVHLTSAGNAIAAAFIYKKIALLIGDKNNLVSNSGLIGRLAEPPIIGSYIANGGRFTSLTATSFSLTNGITQNSGLNTQWKLYNPALSGTNNLSVGIGKSESSGNATYVGWAANSGTPHGYLETYGGGSPLLLQRQGGGVGIGTNVYYGYGLDIFGTTRTQGLYQTTGTGIQWKLYNSALTGTDALSLGVGKSETNGNTLFFGWAANSGSPFGYMETYAGTSPLVFQRSGGSIGVGTSSPISSAIIELSSTTKGFLPPRMTQTQRNAITSPATGLVVYCTNCGTGELQQYNGTSWLSVGSVGTANGILTANGSGTVSAATTTGSGNVVLATSPTLITPALGVPQSGDFSTGTFIWPTFNQNTTGVASNVSGTVAVANGGTGATTVGQARTNLGLGTLATQSGTFSGSSSGTNTGDQTITLIGDVTGSGTGSFSATIANGSVTLAKMANVASGVILGRTTAATGVVEALSGSQVKTLIGLGAAENTAISTWAGSSNITTLGTIGTGVWDGTAIADGKIATALTGKTYNGLNIPSTTGTLAISNSKTLTIPNTITVLGTDGSTFNIGSGGSLANYALLASPALTGVPTAPTATAGTNTTQVATTAYVEDAKNKTLESIQVAFSDETTAITTGNGKLTFYMPYAFTVTEVFLAVKTPQSSGAVFTVDINEEGVSILSTKLTLDNNETKSSTAATAAVVSDTSLAKWATMTIDIDQSSGIAVGGKIIINGYRQ